LLFRYLLLFVILCIEFGRDLEKDVVSDTSGHFRRVLVSACSAGRDQSTHVDGARALKDAQDIYAVRIQPFMFITIFVTTTL